MQKPSSPYAHITPSETRRKLESGAPVVLVDVRTLAEYARHHIAEAILMPLDELPARVGELDHEAEIICICEHGIRSEMAAQYLAALGFSRIATMTGGMAEYQGPVENAESNGK